MSNVVVIGGGAAGMMAAIGAAKTGHKVTIYERNEKLGKKIYITGKGRCNITNAGDMEQILQSIITNEKFMYSALYTLSNEMVMDMFKDDMNVPIKIERGNRVFPVSDKSSDVIYGLQRELDKYNIEVVFNTRVKDLYIENEVVKGIVLNDSKIIKSDSVIVATGGFSYQTTGSDGDGYKLAEKSGHKVTEIIPALVPLTVKEEYAKDLQGLALKNIEVRFMSNGKEVHRDFGEMLFTHFGISGPVILSGSSKITKILNKKKEVSLFIDLKPSLEESVLDERVLRDFSEYINKDFRNSLSDLLPKSLIPVIIKLSGIDQFKKVNLITKEERKKLVSVIKGMELTVTGTRGFMEAIITQGGVSVKDVNPSTMESKKIKNLYFAGEVLDVDALTGGYNLQIAWSTGYLAGISVE